LTWIINRFRAEQREIIATIRRSNERWNLWFKFALGLASAALAAAFAVSAHGQAVDPFGSVAHREVQGVAGCVILT
jgi:hypothetical protein